MLCKVLLFLFGLRLKRLRHYLIILIIETRIFFWNAETARRAGFILGLLIIAVIKEVISYRSGGAGGIIMNFC